MNIERKKNSFIYKTICFGIVLIFLSSCIVGPGKIEIAIKNKKNFNVTVSSVQVINNQIVITGTNLNAVTSFKIKEGSTNTSLQIESQDQHSIVANTLSHVTFASGRVFDFILSNANASATFVVDFSLCDSALGGKSFDCLTVPNDKEVLSFDALSGKWKPRSISGLSYKGVWNATGATPSTTTPGDYYIVSVAGAGYAVGDWTVYRGGGVFDRINNSTAITNVFGRTGAILPVKGDYDLDDLGDIDLTSTPPNTNDVLTFVGGLWIPKPVSAGAGGTVTAVSGTAPISVATGASTPVISMAQSNASTNGYLSSSDWTTFNNKQNTIGLGATTEYYRGDKTFQPLNTTAVAEGSNLYFSNARVLGTDIAGFSNLLTGPITSSDTIVQAFGRAQNQINALASGSGNYLAKSAPDTLAGAVTLTGSITTSGVGDIIVGAPIGGTSAINKNYADGKLDKTAGGVVVGIVTLDNDLKIKGGTNYVTLKGHATSAAYDLVLPSSAGTSGYVLSTDGSGNTSWIAQPTVGGASSVTSSMIVDGTIVNADINAAAAIDYSKLNVPALAIPLTALNATGTKDATKYLKGDNSWSVFGIDVQAVLLSNYVLGTNAVVSAGDSVVAAFGKLQKQISDLAVSAVGGDVSGSLPTLTVVKIQGTPVSVTAPTTGNFFKYDGTNWLGSMVTVGDLKSSALGNLFPGSGCNANQTLYYSVVGDAFTCLDIGSLDGAKITTGTIAAGRLPASASYWSAATGGINYASGNVGIGMTTPGAALDVKGSMRLSGATSGYVGFSPAAVAGSTVYTLPSADGTSGYSLTTNGSGVLSWASSLPLNSLSVYQVRVATTAQITLSGTQTIDGVAVVVGNRVLVKNQTTDSQNGVYVVASGAWTRALDLDTWSESIAYRAVVTEGSVWAGMTFTSATSVGGTIGSSSISWASAGSGSDASETTAHGIGALNSNTTGASNTAHGYNALSANTTGSNNSANGDYTLSSNTTGVNNTAIGFGALSANVGKSGSTAIGYSSMFFADTTSTAATTYNTAVGAFSLRGNSVPSNNTGIKNTAIGYNSLLFLTSGSNNTAIGYNAGADIGTGSNNVIIGSNSGVSFGGGSNNISINDGSGNERIRVLSTGNTGIGTSDPRQKLDVNGKIISTGLSISDFGAPSTDYPIDIWSANPGTPNTYGQNVIIGIAPNSSGDDATIQFGNKYNDPGRMLISRSNSGVLSLGSASTPIINVLDTGNVGIGNLSPTEKLVVNGNIKIVSTATCILGAGSGATNCTSDRRLKENVSPIKNAIAKIKQISGVEFDWNEKSNHPGVHAVGVIAQDVEKIFPTFVITDKSTGYKMVDYAALVAPLIQATKEQQEQIESNLATFKLMQGDMQEMKRAIASANTRIEKIEAENIAKDKEIAELKARLTRIEKMLKAR